MQELKQHLQVIYERTPENDSLFNWMDKATYSNAKLQKKFDNAIESYVGWEAIDIDKGEMYLFLFDDTVFGSAKEGFLITTKAIYFKEIAKSGNKIELANAASATSDKKNKISINYEEISMTMLNDATDSIVEILNQLIAFNSISKDDLLVEGYITISEKFAKNGGTYTELINGHSINIPADTVDGKRWKYNGLGNVQSGVAGDLIVNVTVEVSDPLQELKVWLDNINDEDGDAKEFLTKINESAEEVDKNVVLLIDIAQNFFDYEFSDAGKYANILLKHIEPHASTFGEYIKLARTIADEDYINDKTWAKEIFHKANDLAEGASSKLELAEAIYDYQKDEDWGKTLLKNFEGLADKNPNFDDYYSLGNMIVSDEYTDDKSWAKEVYQKALDINPSSSDYIALCENIANDYYLNDKVWAKELIKKHIAFEDQVCYEKFIDIASMDDLLADEEFTKEIVQNAKEQCDGFDDYLKLFNNIDNGSRATLDMLADVLIDTILVLQTDEQKTQLIEAIEYTIHKDTVEIVKTKSIAELKKMYGKKDENSFEGELELPPLDEIIASDEEQYSEAELIKWMGELTKSVLTFDNPIDEYNKGNYDGCISTLESLIEDSSLDKNINEKYLASLKKHIEILKVENNANEELTLSEPQELELTDDIENIDNVEDLINNNQSKVLERISFVGKSLEVLEFNSGEFYVVNDAYNYSEGAKFYKSTTKAKSYELFKKLRDEYCEKNDYDDMWVGLEVFNGKDMEGLYSQENIEYENLKEFFEKNPLFIESNSEELELTLETPPEPSLEQTNPSDLKTEYANKIASGKIDPIETSYADFEAASQNKEIDYKAVYSQMISEGRIDPTETTYDEMILVSKLFGGVDESEYKATYSKYIGSGEIDPSETTYDEIVSIAKIFNEINGGSSSDGAITKEQLIAELKTFIDTLEDEDDKEIAIDDLAKDNFWYMTFEIDGASDELKRKVLAYYESLTTTTSKFSDIANKLIGLGDIENAVRVYKLAEEKLDNFDDAKLLGNYVVEINQEWSKRLYEKAYQYALKSDKVVNNLCSLAYQMYSKLNDKSWVVQIYNKALEEVENINQLRHIANEIAEEDNTICDKEWGKKLLKEYESKASTFDELYKLLESVISELYLNDNEWGTQVLQKIKPLLNSLDDCTKVIDTLCENKDLTREIFIAGILLIETESEQEDLAYYAEDYVDDEGLQKDLKKLTIEELKNKYGKPSTDELKKLYAAGIGSGEIDPVETSFDSFEKNYGNSNDNS